MPLNKILIQAQALKIKRALKKKGLTAKGANPPIIYLPGIIGTKLYDTVARVNVWGDPRPILFPKANEASYALGQEALSEWSDREKKSVVFPKVIATEQLHSFSVIPGVYDTLVTAGLALVLKKALGYREGRDLFFLGHDWRKDYRLLSIQLDQMLEQIKLLYGENCPVVLMGQSVSSLAISYWLRHTSEANFKQVVRCYSFGPPWEGTFHALSMLQEGYYPASKYFRGFSAPDIQTYPSAYQLLPSNPVVINSNGRVINDFSFYNLETWQQYGIGPLHGNQYIDYQEFDLRSYLKLGEDFSEALKDNQERFDSLSQVWFLSDNNLATRKAVWIDRELLVKVKDIKQKAPHLVKMALAVGDDHLPLESFIKNPNGPFVRDYGQIPYGENYMLVGQSKNHRNLINYGPNLQALAFDLAVLRKTLDL